MPIFQVPGVGPVSLPDGLKEDEYEQVVRKLVESSGSATSDRAPYTGGELFKSAAGRTLQQMGASALYDLPALGLAGLAKLGFGGAEDKALEFLQRGKQRYAEIERDFPTQYRDVTKLQGPSEYLGYGVEKIGEALPQIATAMIPGGAAAFASRNAAKLAGQEAMKAGIQRGLPAALAEREAVAASSRLLAGRAGAATTGTSFAQTAPDSFREIFETTGQMDPGLAIVAGAANSLLESYVPNKILGQLGGFGRLKLVEKTLERGGFAKEAAKIGAKTAFVMAQEGLTEAAQDIVNGMAIKTIDANYEIFSPENINKYINSLAAGALGGMAPGAVGALADRTRPELPRELIQPRGLINSGVPVEQPVAPQQSAAPQQTIPPVTPPVTQGLPQVTQPVAEQAAPVPTIQPPVQPSVQAPVQQAVPPGVQQQASVPPVQQPVQQQSIPPVSAPVTAPITAPVSAPAAAPAAVPPVVPVSAPAAQIAAPQPVSSPPLINLSAPVEPGPPESVEPPPEQGPQPVPEDVAMAMDIERELLARREQLEKGKGSLWSALKGRVSYEDIKDASPDIGYRMLAGKPTNPNYKGLDLLIKDGDLDAWLPSELQSFNFEKDPTLEVEAANHIKDRLAQKDLMTDSTKQEIEAIEFQLSEIIPFIRDYLDELEANLEAAEAANEQRPVYEQVGEAVPESQAGVDRAGQAAGQRPVPKVTPAVTQAVTVPPVTQRPASMPSNVTKKERDMYDTLRAEMDALGLKDLVLDIVRPKRIQRKNTTGYTLGSLQTRVQRTTDAAGQEQLIAIGRVMKVALDLAKRTKSKTAQDPQEIRKTLHHEVIHALRSMSLFTADEWKILSDASAKDWVNRKWPGDNGLTVKDLYKGRPLDMQLEEGVARAFENYTMGEFQPKGAVARIFQKTKEFFQKLADYALGLGITETEAEIFERVLSGEIGSRVRKDPTLFRQPYKLVQEGKATKQDEKTLAETEEIIMDAVRLDVDPEGSMNGLLKSGPDFKEIKKSTADYIKDLSVDKADILLSALNLRQLGELASDALPQVKKFYRAVSDMLAMRDTRITKAADIAKMWVAFNDKHPKIAQILADVMHDATIAGIDPDKNLDKIKNKELIDNWQVISSDPEALDIYRKVRDYYAESLNIYQQALEQRIKESMEEGREKTKALYELEQEFNRIKQTGPYFPLARFGDYWVSFKTVDKEGKKVPEYYMFENRREQRKFIDDLVKQGVEYQSGIKTSEMLSQGVPMTGFVRNLMELVDKTDGDTDVLKDGIWQMFLTMQPDLSARKHFIHRKKVKGYSNDALRAFAETSFHGAYHLARVQYNGRLEALMLEAQKYKKENPSIEAERYYEELLKRKNWVNAPEDVNSFTSWATSVSFMYFLTAPASALVNIAQTPMVAFPYLGAKFGFGNAFKELSRASKEFFASGASKEKGFYDILRTLEKSAKEKGISDAERKRRQEELEAMQQLYDDGTLNRTQTLSLAGLAERPSDILQGGIGTVMRNKSFSVTQKVTYALGYSFNQAEVFNRQITAISAYRSARKSGKTHDVSLQMAKDIVNETHFEYTNATKPRFMQGPTARIFFQFKNYAQQMTYLLVRTLNEAVRGADQDVKDEARKRLTGILFMTGIFAGYEGLPLFWVIEGVMNALFDDEDEPYDFTNSAKNNLADMFGSNAARMLSKGVVSEILGGDIANRVSMNGMWFRDSNRSADEVQAFNQFVTDLAGPFVGIGANFADGIKKFNDGNYMRGTEAMLPPVLKDFLKVLRFSTEGATTLRGDPIVGDISTWGLFLQALGFTPTEVARSYEAMSEIKGMERDIDRRRKRLLQQYTLADMNGDIDTVEEVREKIDRFNEKNPSNPITKQSINRSIAQRTKDSDRAVRGIIVSPKREDLLEGARYLGEEE